MDKEITIKYQEGTVTGGYAFSANSTDITLSGYVKDLPETDQEVIVFEAKTARQNYIDTVVAKKAASEKVNPLTIKREAVDFAQKATINQYGEEEFNRVKEIINANKGGTLSVTGKKSAPKGAKTATSKGTAKSKQS